MPNWSDILHEIQVTSSQPGPLDVVRRKYLKKFSQLRKRNVITYYSGWLQKPNFGNTEIDDNDKNGFMNAVHGMERSKGLDLILHTPGGQVAAVESLVSYLRVMFDDDIIAFVPQLAMSAGTMMACACREIVMGKQSNLGPIDPQFNGIAAAGVIQEFFTAKEEVLENAAAAPFWKIILGKYPPSFVLECLNAMNWSTELVTGWLTGCMLKGDSDAAAKATQIADKLSDYNNNKSHGRHLDMQACKDLGLKIITLEENQKLQEALLSVHHTYMHTFSGSPAVKIIENQKGVATVIMGEKR